MTKKTQRFLVKVTPNKKGELEKLIGYKLKEPFNYRKVRLRYNQMKLEEIFSNIRIATKSAAKLMKEQELYQEANIDLWKSNIIKSLLEILVREEKIKGKNYLPAN